MKTIIIALFLVAISNISFAQYAGEMTSELLNKLSAEERELYWDCLRECGFNKDSIVWLSDSNSNKLGEDNEYFSTTIIRRTLKSDKIFTITIPGKNRLQYPECLVFIRRIDDNTELRLAVYQ